MEFLVIPNVLLYLWAFIESVKRTKRTNVRRWLRIPAAAISLYICIVYSLVLFDVIQSFDVPALMRWFQLVIAGYIIAEAKNE